MVYKVLVYAIKLIPDSHMVCPVSIMTFAASPSIALIKDRLKDKDAKVFVYDEEIVTGRSPGVIQLYY